MRYNPITAYSYVATPVTATARRITSRRLLDGACLFQSLNSVSQEHRETIQSVHEHSLRLKNALIKSKSSVAEGQGHYVSHGHRVNSHPSYW